MSTTTGFTIGAIGLLVLAALLIAGLALIIWGAGSGKKVPTSVGILLLCTVGVVIVLPRLVQPCAVDSATAVALHPPNPPAPPAIEEDLPEEAAAEAETKNGIETAAVRINSDDDSGPSVEVRSRRHGGRVTIDSRGVHARSDETNTSASDRVFPNQVCKQTVLGFVGRIGALGLLILLAYLFLDAGRHRRYTWPRRITIAAAFIAVCVFLWRIGPLM